MHQNTTKCSFYTRLEEENRNHKTVYSLGGRKEDYNRRKKNNAEVHACVCMCMHE